MNDEVIKKTTGMKANSIDDLSADFYRLDIKLREQVCKKIISCGGPWVSVGFVYRDRRDSYCEFGSPKVMLASFKSSRGEYNRNSYYIIKNKEEAQKVCDILKETFNL